MAQPKPSTPPQPASPVAQHRPQRPRFNAQEIAKRKTHGIIGHLSTLVLQPRLFFYTFPQTRHWLVVAVLMIGAMSYISIQRSGLEATPIDGGAIPIDPGLFDPSAGGFGDVPIDPSAGGGFGDVPIDPSAGGGFGDVPIDPNDPFGIPLPSDGGGGQLPGASGGGDVNNQLNTAVLGGGWVVLVWVVQACLLMFIPLTNGKTPDFGKNLQVAVWSSLPMLIPTILFVVSRNAGVTDVFPGWSFLIRSWSDFATLDPAMQMVLYSFLAKISLFSLWSLFLLWHGATATLHGKPLPSLVVMLAWIVIAVMIPVLLGMVEINPGVMPV
jgi:hypothetical protein